MAYYASHLKLIGYFILKTPLQFLECTHFKQFTTPKGQPNSFKTPLRFLTVNEGHIFLFDKLINLSLFELFINKPETSIIHYSSRCF